MQPRCALCEKAASLRCTKCKKVYYCSPTCQHNHWYVHKRDCGILKNDYTTRKDRKTYDYINSISFEEDNSSVTIVVPIPMNCPKESIHVDIQEQSVSIQSSVLSFSSDIDLHGKIKLSSATWSFSEGELILYAEKKTLGLWESLYINPVSSSDSCAITQHNSYFVLFFPSTNKVHIILQTNHGCDSECVSVKVKESSESTAINPISLLEIRWKEKSVSCRQEILVNALLSVENGKCEIDSHSNSFIILDLNCKQFGEDIRLMVDCYEKHQSYEILQLQKTFKNLYCSRCLEPLLQKTVTNFLRAPSALWSDLSEMLYCEHGGSIHLHPHLSQSGIISKSGALFIRDYSFFVHEDDCKDATTIKDGVVSCVKCNNILGNELTDNNGFKAIEIMKDRVRLQPSSTIFYSITQRLLLLMMDFYRSKFFTNFYLYCKTKHIRIHLQSVDLYCQSDIHPSSLMQAICFNVDFDCKHEDDICIELAMLELLAFITDIKRSSFTGSFLRTVNNQEFFALTKS